MPWWLRRSSILENTTEMTECKDKKDHDSQVCIVADWAHEQELMRRRGAVRDDSEDNAGFQRKDRESEQKGAMAKTIICPERGVDGRGWPWRVMTMRAGEWRGKDWLTAGKLSWRIKSFQWRRKRSRKKLKKKNHWKNGYGFHKIRLTQWKGWVLRP